jgi:hypothetical protein
LGVVVKRLLMMFTHKRGQLEAVGKLAHTVTVVRAVVTPGYSAERSLRLMLGLSQGAVAVALGLAIQVAAVAGPLDKAELDKTVVAAAAKPLAVAILLEPGQQKLDSPFAAVTFFTPNTAAVAVAAAIGAAAAALKEVVVAAQASLTRPLFRQVY